MRQTGFRLDRTTGDLRLDDEGGERRHGRTGVPPGPADPGDHAGEPDGGVEGEHRPRRRTDGVGEHGGHDLTGSERVDVEWRRRRRIPPDCGEEIGSYEALGRGLTHPGPASLSVAELDPSRPAPQAGAVGGEEGVLVAQHVTAGVEHGATQAALPRVGRPGQHDDAPIDPHDGSVHGHVVGEAFGGPQTEFGLEAVDGPWKPEVGSERRGGFRAGSAIDGEDPTPECRPPRRGRSPTQLGSQTITVGASTKSDLEGLTTVGLAEHDDVRMHLPIIADDAGDSSADRYRANVEHVADLADGLAVSWCRATADACDTVMRLFAEVDDPKPHGLCEWQYLRPGAPAYVAFAHDERGPIHGAVAMYAAAPVPVRVNGSAASAIQSFDTLTLPEFRGRGLFTTLARTVYEAAGNSGECAVFGFPNANSVPGFTRSLGWTVPGEVELLVRPIGARYLRVRAVMRKPTVLEPAESPSVEQVFVERASEIDAILETAVPSNGTGSHRDARRLQYRLGRPGADYRLNVIEGPASMRALSIGEVQLKHGCAVGYLMDAWAQPGDATALAASISALVVDLRQRGADLVLAWAPQSSPLRSVLRRHGFTPLPRRLRPFRLYFGGTTLDSSPERPPDFSHWSYSYLDSDTV